MSELERAAAEHARLQAERARNEAAERAVAEKGAAHERQRLHKAVTEFFAFARRHNAPLFQLYSYTDSQEKGFQYTRTKHQCVAAVSWDASRGGFAWRGWAVTADGSFFGDVSSSEPWRPRFRDSRVVAVERTRPGQPDGNAYLGGPVSASSYDYFLKDFVAAASALMTPVDLGKGRRTGLQPDGWIGYRL